MSIKYPFIPKSNTYLQQGQFWGIKLSNGFYACGRVLQVPNKNDGTKSLFAGLMDWQSDNLPTFENLAGHNLIHNNFKAVVGHCHVKTIVETGNQILGQRDLHLDNIEIPLEVCSNFSEFSYLVKGFEEVRKSIKEDHTKYKIQSTWGYEYIRLLAERYFVEKKAVIF